MSVWLTIPSARPVSEIAPRLQKWRDMGYKLALWRNGLHRLDPIEADHLINTEHYHGWGPSSNVLIREVMALDRKCDWFVCGGDDTDPDPTKRAEEIAKECELHFARPQGEAADGSHDDEQYRWDEMTFGVMQPTGDRWGEDEPWSKMAFPDAPAYIDRICGSPWIGREFVRRMAGMPFWPELYHMFADECLQEVAKRLGILWQRRDLTHHHEHCRRDGIPRMPDFAQQSGIYGSEEWNKSKAIFERLKADGFRECMPIE